jgi:hypothetical protein
VQGRADAARSSQEIEAAVLEQMKARHALEQQLETERSAHLKAAHAVRELEAQVQQEQTRANAMQQLPSLRDGACMPDVCLAYAQVQQEQTRANSMQQRSSSATEREGTLLKRAVSTLTYA